MEKQNPLEENNVRKDALKMTAIFMVLTVFMEIVALVLASLVLERIEVAAFDNVSMCVLLMCLNIAFAVAVYFEFKKVVMEYEKRMKEMKRTTE